MLTKEFLTPHSSFLRGTSIVIRRQLRNRPLAAIPIASGSTSQQHRCRVFAATDLHVDYPENLEWCRRISSAQHRHDALIVAGDVSDDLGLLEEALGTLAESFGWVFYTPGNHELWLRAADAGLPHSLAKLEAVWGICAALGVHTAPTRVGPSLWVVPMLSWHHRSFDTEPDIPDVPEASRWTIADYAACRWPRGLLGPQDEDVGLGGLELARWFDAQNDCGLWEQVLASRQHCDVISFSHFLPSQALLPEKRFLYYPNLPKAVGSLPLAARLQALRPDIHVFGHTHFAWDATIDGVRYIQAPLCSPAERRRRLFTVGFESSMAAAEADPEGAAWLPLQIYECWMPQGHFPAGSSSSSGSGTAGSLNGASVSMASSASMGSSWLGSVALGSGEGGGGGGGGGSSGEGVVADEEAVAAMDQAMHGIISSDSEEETLELPLPTSSASPKAEVALGSQKGGSAAAAAVGTAAAGVGPAGEAQAQQQRQQQRQKQRRKQAAAVAAPSSGGSSGQHSHSLGEGAVRLRHGWMPGSLGAHWSQYYETHPRDPSCLSLAPWVARVYERRRRRSGSKEGSSTATA